MFEKILRNSIISYNSDETTIKIWDTDAGHCLKVLKGKTQGDENLILQGTSNIDLF